MKIFSILTTVLFSTSAIAHTGHMANESWHSFLHVEHIIALVSMGIVAVAIKKLLNK